MLIVYCLISDPLALSPLPLPRPLPLTPSIPLPITPPCVSTNLFQVAGGAVAVVAAGVAVPRAVADRTVVLPRLPTAPLMRTVTVLLRDCEDALSASGTATGPCGPEVVAAAAGTTNTYVNCGTLYNDLQLPTSGCNVLYL